MTVEPSLSDKGSEVMYATKNEASDGLRTRLIATHFMVWGGKLLYGRIPWYGMGSGHTATKMSSIHVGHVVFHNMLLCCCQQARTICFHCADKLYRYQLTLKAVVFTIILMECITLVNEMLLMMSGDIQPNPGPGECLYRAYY